MLKRHAEAGLPGLRDASRAPKTHPNQTPPEQEAAILKVRKAFPTWGSKKILWKLDRERPSDDWPARSTVDEILRRAGVVTPRGKRPRRQPTSPPRVEALAPNDVWSMDYKGCFRVGDGTRCDPLTINDVHSRASLVCQAMVQPRSNDVRRRLEEAFGAFGLPKYMLSDGGPPFGSNGLGRLSRLGVWLVRLGVTPVLIEPGRPDQNGRHERFHETLKAETAMPPRSSIRAQQQAFDRFQETYNHERPHEALGMKPPGEVYELSPRPLPSSLPEHQYADGLEQRVRGRDGRAAGVRRGAVARASRVAAAGHPAREIAHDRADGGRCHPCARTGVSPMFPVAQGRDSRCSTRSRKGRTPTCNCSCSASARGVRLAP